MEKLQTPMDKAFVAMSIITWIAGAAVLSVGLVLTLDDETFDQVKLLDSTTLWEATVYLTVTAGGYTFVIGFVGWIGYLFRNRNTLLAYIVLGSIAGAVLLSSGFLAVVYKLDINSDETNTTLYQSIRNNTSAWDDYQENFQCCGVQSPDDWPFLVPKSCCTNVTIICKRNEAFKTGCYEVMKNGIDSDTALIMGLSFGVFSVQLISTALGGVLYGTDNVVAPLTCTD